ncbi:hypothetical protein EWW49_29785, partial [Pseudomonas syringae]
PRRRRLWGEHAQSVQADGVTEATLAGACSELAPDSHVDAVLPIGRALANARIYLLDTAGERVPQGVTGELYIGGAGVARGDLNLPELTRERFIDSPFGAGERLDRTGDPARDRADGPLEFPRRNDSHAKLRGLRLARGEIGPRQAEGAGGRGDEGCAREAAPR